MICPKCQEEKTAAGFYERSDRQGLRTPCKTCLNLMQKVKKMKVRFPVQWPPTLLNWLTPITPYDPDKECSKLEQPSHEYKVHTVISDPESTAEDDAQSSD